MSREKEVIKAWETARKECKLLKDIPLNEAVAMIAKFEDNPQGSLENEVDSYLIDLEFSELRSAVLVAEQLREVPTNGKITYFVRVKQFVFDNISDATKKAKEIQYYTNTETEVGYHMPQPEYKDWVPAWLIRMIIKKL